MINPELIDQVLKKYHIERPQTEVEWLELWNDILPNLLQVDPTLLEDLEMQTGLVQATEEDTDKVGMIIQALIVGVTRNHQIGQLEKGDKPVAVNHQRSSQVVAFQGDGQTKLVSSDKVSSTVMHRSDMPVVDTAEGENLDQTEITGQNLSQVKKNKTTRKVGPSGNKL